MALKKRYYDMINPKVAKQPKESAEDIKKRIISKISVLGKQDECI